MTEATERRVPLKIRGKIDPYLFLSVIALVAFGIVMVFSASTAFSIKKCNTPYYFLVKHLIFTSIGLILMLIISRIDVMKLADPKKAYLLLGISALLCLIVFVPGIGTVRNGAHRWINLRISTFEPSELLKCAFVIWMAASLAKREPEKLRTLRFGFLPHVTVAGILAIVMVAQPDFGSAVLIFGICFAMMFLGGVRFLYIGGAGILASIGAAALIIAEPYRVKRVVSFLDPWKDPLGKSYQVVQSLIAFGSGGLWGRGLGQGRQKLFYLPEMHTDFILANVGEELGFIWVLIILALFAILVFRGFHQAISARNRFLSLLSSGIAVLLGAEIIINGGVVMSLLPTKGIALPFISYGGSSELMSFIVVGLLMAAGRRADERTRAYLARMARAKAVGGRS